MKANRITYSWRHDTIYTFIWAIFITSLFVLILQTLIHPGKPIIVPLLALNGLFVPLITFFIGLRPILSLFTIPDILFLNEKGQLITSDMEIIFIKDIQSLEINQVGGIGASHLIYYEMTLNKSVSVLKNKKRKTLILTEPYNIKYIFQSRTDLMEKLENFGLEKDKIKINPYKVKHFFGFRDKFKK